VLFRKSNTTLVGPSPAPGFWMHSLRRNMPLWRVLNRLIPTFTSSALSYFMCLMNVQAVLYVPKIDESTNCLGRCCRRRVGKGVEEIWVGVMRRMFWISMHAFIL